MEDKTLSAKRDSNHDYLLIVIVVAVVAICAIWIGMNPEGSLITLGNVSNGFVELTKWFFMPFPLIILVVSVWWAFSKYGKLKLGNPETKADYSLFSYVAMIVCAGLGSGTCVLAFVEWGFYYSGPPFGITPFTPAAAEMAEAYNLFHWGWTVQCCNLLFTIPICYSYYIRKNETARMGDVFGIMYGKENTFRTVVVKVVNLIVMFCIVGGLCCTLGLGIPIVSRCLQSLFGFQNLDLLNIILILLISVIFSFSSVLGLKKGLKRLTSANAYWAIAFMLIFLVTGATGFILTNIVNGFGIMLDNFPRMSLYMDSVEDSGFPMQWTVFYYAWAWAFSAMTSVFTIKVSKGRTFKQMILTTIFIGPAGIWIFLGVLGSYSMNLELTGVVDVTGIMAAQGNHFAVLEVLKASSLGPVIGVAAFFIMTILFLSTTLDAASFTLATVSTKKLGMEEEPKPVIRLFWCLCLALIPLVLTSIDAPLDALQSIVNIVSIPILIVGVYLWFRLSKWMKEDKGTYLQHLDQSVIVNEPEQN